jgi:hypothetical protein
MRVRSTKSLLIMGQDFSRLNLTRVTSIYVPNTPAATAHMIGSYFHFTV